MFYFEYWYVDNETVSIIKHLLEQPSIMIHIKNNNGRTPLDIIKSPFDYCNGRRDRKHEKPYLKEISQLLED